MNYRAAYSIGFHPWEDASRDPPFVAVPNDPSRVGQGIVKVPGIARLGLELLVFGAGAYGWVHVMEPKLM